MPGTPAPAAHYLKLVFERTLRMYRPGEPAGQLRPGTHLNAWDWGPGIALYGLYQASFRLDPAARQEFQYFWRDWLETNLGRQPPTPAINGALLLNLLWQTTGDPDMPFSGAERALYRDYCRERVDFYLEKAHRTVSGAFAHTVATGSPDSFRQVWSDNLFMLVLLLARVAASDNDTALFGQMVRQLELHFRHLGDRASGLLYHGWQFDPQDGPETDLAGYRGSHLNGATWGRGNAWAAMGVAELLELACRPGLETFRQNILEIARPFFEALRACQLPGGDWNTLLNQPWSYPETSATAGIAFAFLKVSRLGLPEPTFRAAGLAALAAVVEQIAPDGEVRGVSGSTPLLESLEAYNRVPNNEISTWGQGFALLALAEGTT